MLQAATIFAAQANQAGVNLKVKQESTSVYYTPAGGWFKAPFRDDYAVPLPSLGANYLVYLSSAPGSYNESFWTKQQPGGAAAASLISKAIGERDASSAQKYWSEVQHQQLTDGGVMVFANADFVHLAQSKVKGVTESQCGFLNNGRLTDAWLAA
jgi:ABC-type transport system substrate-binding protein